MLLVFQESMRSIHDAYSPARASGYLCLQRLSHKGRMDMRKIFFSLFIVVPLVLAACADSGLVSVKSSRTVPATAARLEKALKQKGMTVFARINHAQGAQRVGKTLRPTELVIFGNPKVGTPLMQCGQSVGIDLPQKALIWEDQSGQVWLTYNAPRYLAKRHGLTGCDEIVKKIEKALSSFAAAAAGI